MPYINITTTVKMTDEQKAKMNEGLGKNITLIEGKEAKGLIIAFVDGVDMFFRTEKTEKGAFVDVRLYTESKYEEKEAFAKSVSVLFKEILDIDEQEVTLNMIELYEWGSRGKYNRTEK
ncbi:MAG: hypothetical protein R3Y12_04570 [Clostridia bacterium]